MSSPIIDHARKLIELGAVVMPRLAKDDTTDWGYLYDAYKYVPQPVDWIEQGTEGHSIPMWGNMLGIITARGWVCVDFDGKSPGRGMTKDPVDIGAVRAFCQALGIDADTYEWIERTPSGGYHVWLRCFVGNPEKKSSHKQVRSEWSETLGGIDLLCGRNFAVASPSIDAEGKSYAFTNDGTRDTPPVVVDYAQILTALERVVILSTVERMEPNKSKKAKGTGGWMQDAKESYPLLEKVTEHVASIINAEPSEVSVQRVGEYHRIGKGTGAGGWHVGIEGTKAEGTWFANGLGLGGDGINFANYYATGKTRWDDLNDDEKSRVRNHIEQETGIATSPITATEVKTRKSGDGGKVMPELVHEWIERSDFVFRYNEVKSQLEYTHKGEQTWRDVNDRTIDSWITAFEVMSRKYCAPSRFYSYLRDQRLAKSYDPIQEYFDGLAPWDGETDHILELAEVMSTKDNERFYKQLTKWLVGAFACGYHTGRDRNNINELFLILYSAEQGVGKTTFLQALVPASLREYMHVGTITDDKDSQALQARSWISLNDELATMRKASHEHLKMVLSMTHYTFRPVYGHTIEHHPRRISFCGSTNEDNFLVDYTGNRRFLTHTVVDLNREKLRGIDIDKVWAQAKALYGVVPHYLSRDEITEQDAHNSQFVVSSYVDHLVAKYLQPGIVMGDGHWSHDTVFATSFEIAEGITKEYDRDNNPIGLGGGGYRPSPEKVHIQLGKALRKAGYEPKAKRHGDVVKRGYFVRIGKNTTEGLPGEVSDGDVF